MRESFSPSNTRLATDLCDANSMTGACMHLNNGQWIG